MIFLIMYTESVNWFSLVFLTDLLSAVFWEEDLLFSLLTILCMLKKDTETNFSDYSFPSFNDNKWFRNPAI